MNKLACSLILILASLQLFATFSTEDYSDIAKSGLPFPHNPNCFPGFNTVELQDGSVVALANVKAGDMVKVSENEYSEVIIPSQQKLDEQFTFLVIETQFGNLPITFNHSVQALKQNINSEIISLSEDLEIGDHLLFKGQYVPITGVSKIRSNGLYSPVTESKSVMINNFVTYHGVEIKE